MPAHHLVQLLFAALVGAVVGATVIGVVARSRRRRLAARVDEATRVAADLRRTNEALQRYAGALAHDLRSPVAVIVSTLELLLVRLDLDERQISLIQTAARRGRRCVEIAGELLDQARLVADHVERAPVPLGAVVDDALDQLSADVAERRPELSIAPLPTVSGNHVLLVQVFQNLLANAMRHGSAGTDARITISSQEIDGMARVVVADDGPGIPPHAREHVFRYGRSTSGDSTGIGLATVSSLVAAHGGTVTAEEGPLGGAAIVVTLPLAEDPERVIDLATVAATARR